MAITAGTWVPIKEIGLNQAIDVTSTTQNYPIGHKVRCRDIGTNNYGEAEFVYLTGVASVAAGDLCVIDGALVARAAARSVGPACVAMSACVASNYGWFQVFGVAKVACDTIADNKQAYIDGTTGRIDDAVVAGDIVYGMRTTSSDDTGFCTAMLLYPADADTDNS